MLKMLLWNKKQGEPK